MPWNRVKLSSVVSDTNDTVRFPRFPGRKRASTDDPKRLSKKIHLGAHVWTARKAVAESVRGKHFQGWS